MPITLFFSDLHLGREPERDSERLDQVLACVRHELMSAGDAESGSAVWAGARPPSGAQAIPGPPTVVFLGDTFDAFVDAPRRMPPVALPWIGLVDEIRALGAAVRFFSGNHDRWHAGNLERRAGVTPDRGPAYLPHPSAKVLASHGDEADALPAHERLIKRLSDTRLAHLAYRTALPFGAAQRIAAWASVRLASPGAGPGDGDEDSGASQEQTVTALRRSAASHIQNGGATVVVYGHAHRAELAVLECGTYLNTGDWYRNRTYGVLSGTHVRLARWTASKPSPDTLAEHVLL